MKSLKTVLVAALAVGAFAPSCFAAETSTARMRAERVTNIDKAGDFGLGGQWGGLTGVNAKYWATEKEAVDLGVSFLNGNTAVNADYLYHFREGLYGIFGTAGSRTVVPFVGGGLVTAFGTNTDFFGRNTGSSALAVRVPLGLEFLPRNAPIGVFGEIAPSLGLTPTNYTFLTADLGARYYF